MILQKHYIQLLAIWAEASKNYPHQKQPIARVNADTFHFVPRDDEYQKARIRVLDDRFNIAIKKSGRWVTKYVLNLNSENYHKISAFIRKRHYEVN